MIPIGTMCLIKTCGCGTEGNELGPDGVGKSCMVIGHGEGFVNFMIGLHGVELADNRIIWAKKCSLQPITPPGSVDDVPTDEPVDTAKPKEPTAA